MQQEISTIGTLCFKKQSSFLPRSKASCLDTLINKTINSWDNESGSRHFVRLWMKVPNHSLYTKWKEVRIRKIERKRSGQRREERKAEKGLKKWATTWINPQRCALTFRGKASSIRCSNSCFLKWNRRELRYVVTTVMLPKNARVATFGPFWNNLPNEGNFALKFKKFTTFLGLCFRKILAKIISGISENFRL